VALVIAIGILIIHLTTTKQKTVNGPEAVTGSIAAISYPTQLINEPYFTIRIPKTWHQTSFIDNSAQYTITWMDVSQSKDTRWLTVYVDKILPNLAINNLLPIRVVGDSLKYGLLSDNCTSFASHTINQQTALASYQGINFICDIADIVGEVSGTGTVGSINKTTITGPTSGTHSYFFEYVERSGEPNYSYFDNALTSFRAK